ncbi:M56 family metallopeptidase [uncultured Winogradskyella sp.]|uniref:M56 family metallopeptidase n=1 Tax=uncultured Winogradskyella sp. TaxID=395353 RepID=UPI002620448E|nr:M56 family metallopeptidase [uncultured Winogradskyella sp.]
MDYLLKSSALLLLMYLGYTFFLKKETFFNHNRWFLLAGLVTALVLPLIVIPVYITIEPITIVETPTFYANTYAEIIPNEKPFDWLQLLTNIYTIGLVVFFIQFVLQFGSLAFLLLKNSKDKDGIYTYVIVKNKISPFSFFKWIVYNPNLFSDEELKLILNHEKVHVRQWHSMDIIISRLTCVIFWFNPFTWLYHKDIQQNLEYIADANAQNASNSETDYQRLLLKTSVGDNTINLTSNFYNSLIKKRIIMLQKQPSKSINRWKSIFILPLFVIFLMSFNTKEVYIEAESAKNNEKKTIEFIVTKNTSDNELYNMSEAVSKKGGTLNFSDIKRNSRNEITNVYVNFFNHSYVGGDSKSPIESFIVYKQLYGNQGGYVGTPEGATIHFKNNNIPNKKDIDALEKDMIELGMFTKLIEVVFSKSTSDKELNKIKSELAKQDIIMTINEIERNSDGIITEIDLSFKFNEGMTNYKAEDSDGIKPFYFKTDNNGSVSVGPITNKVIEIIEEPEVIEIIEVEGEPIIEIIEEVEEIEEIEDDTKQNRFIIHDAENEVEIEADSIVIVEGQPKVRASYTYISNDTIVVNRPVTATVKANGNVKVRSNSFTIKTDSVNYKNSFKIRNSKNTDPIYILNGKRISKKEFQKINSNKIKTVDVLKDKSAIKLYGKAAKDGVVVINTEEKGPWKISTKVNSINSYKEASSDEIKQLIASGKKPVIVIDNEVMGNIKIKDIDYDVAKSVSILKGEGAINLFGKKAKDGAIVIFTKDYKVKHDKSNHKVHVQSIVYADDDVSESAILYYVTKDTSDEELKQYKSKLAEQNITAKFNKIKRNDAGEITSIKISLSDKNGAKSSASWKDDDGISKILVGKKGNKLITSSSY